MNETSSLPTTNDERRGAGAHSSPVADYVEIKAFATGSPTPAKPLFPHLVHLAFARPQTVLSVAADTYSVSTVSQASSSVDPWIEAELVQCWAQALLRDFPQLDILEAWSDWTGQDNDSLNYYLPRQEPLASTWEFLSGIEQDLWDDGQEHDTNEPERWDDDFEEGISFDVSRGSGDWDRASLINEFPEEQDFADSGYLEVYEEEPEDMVTPIDDRKEWFSDSNRHVTTGSADSNRTQKSDQVNVKELGARMNKATLETTAQPKP